ncbi:MAG: hypothetical protein RJB68_2110 [Pseudomonadota bacterium]
MSKHTPAPWLYTQSGKDCFSIIEPDGHTVVHMTALQNSTAASQLPGNARRIVACVNACEGLTTQEIEQGDQKSNVRLMHQIVGLRKEREALLDALKSFLRAPSVGSNGPGSITIVVQDFNMKAARTAIAEAQGGEA